MANFFAHKTAAQRYALSRPYFHPIVIERIRQFLDLQAPVAHALDTACGTGQSALALRAIAERVSATDIAPEMLSQVPPEDGIEYVEAPAEALPFADDSFDLATVSLAFHWFDRERFLSEARHVLKTRAWLVIYNNGFYGTMRENPAFAEWNQQQYMQRYRTPPRHSQPLNGEDAARCGFRFAHREEYTNDVQFSPEELAAYLTTQSNVIAAVEQGSESEVEVYAWLIESLTPLFPEAIGTFPFGGDIWYLQKA